jgi:hypothetical protein
MFRFTTDDLYCSEAATSNVHVLGRLVPLPNAKGVCLCVSCVAPAFTQCVW